MSTLSRFLGRFISRFLSRFLSSVLLISLLASCSQSESQSESKNTVLIDNVQGYSFNNQRELFHFTAMAIRDGKVLATGDSQLSKDYPQAEKIDAQGKTLIPGIIDAHGHVSSLGFTLLSVDVSAASNPLSKLPRKSLTTPPNNHSYSGSKVAAGIRYSGQISNFPTPPYSTN